MQRVPDSCSDNSPPENSHAGSDAFSPHPRNRTSATAKPLFILCKTGAEFKTGISWICMKQHAENKGAVPKRSPSSSLLTKICFFSTPHPSPRSFLPHRKKITAQAGRIRVQRCSFLSQHLFEIKKYKMMGGEDGGFMIYFLNIPNRIP